MTKGNWIYLILIAAVFGTALGGFIEEYRSSVSVDGEQIHQCATEESTGPCIWDAKTQGNKKGQSFYLDAEGRIYPIGEDTP